MAITRSAPAPLPTGTDRTVRVWWQPVDGAEPAATDPAWRLLDAGERERLARFQRPADRALYLAAHVLLRRALSHQVPAVAPEEWRFSAPANHRPELAPGFAGHNLRFNLSHAAGLAACAVTVGAAVGIDVESLTRPFADLDGVAHLLAAEEAAHLRRQPDGQRHGAFIEIWTLKEAYAKARGLGLALPLDSYAVATDPPRMLRTDSAGGAPAQWQLALHRPTPDFALALAIPGDSGDAPRPIHLAPFPP